MLINENNIKSCIHDYLEGEMSAEKVDALWAYLLGSPDDMDYLETLATLKTMGEKGELLADEDHTSTGTTGQKEPVRIYQLRKYLVAAAVLIVSITFSYAILQQSDTTAGPTPISSIEYNTERSADQGTTFDDYVNSAVEQSAEGNVDEAMKVLASAYENLSLTNDQRNELRIVEGSVLYNGAKYEDAKVVFESLANEKESIDFMDYEKSVWYLANTYLQLNERELARQKMQEVVELDGAYNRVARKSLDSF